MTKDYMLLGEVYGLTWKEKGWTGEYEEFGKPSKTCTRSKAEGIEDLAQKAIPTFMKNLTDHDFQYDPRIEGVHFHPEDLFFWVFEQDIGKSGERKHYTNRIKVSVIPFSDLKDILDSPEEEKSETNEE